MIRAVTHLIDDASFGGINRMLDHMTTSPALGGRHHHRIARVQRGQFSPPKLSTDIIVSHLSISWANLAMLTALRAIYPNNPLIHVEHSYCERFAAARVANRLRFDTLLKTAYSLFDKVVAVSEAQGAWMQRRGYCAPSRLETIPSCVDLSPFFDLADKPRGSTFTIGAIGRFDEQKGFDILIDAFRANPRHDLQLALFGDGPDRQRLMDRAGCHPRIAFHGYVPNTADAVAQCDAIAMPSRWEPYGLVALEAMAAGRPLLCPRIDGLSDHIRSGATNIGENSVDGWKAFLEKMEAYVELDDSRRLRRAARLAEDRFLLGWNELLDTVVGSNADHAEAA
ncbi:glycosyltransferase family 4 protein [Notoacmeibacter sp. MSK16QG-6]|uniref:glycosyltransferase family 4 protein n=1 Tax=Notoacmeibacter sp. MSK16QG-6 TaxID=2957982 RepID=UPI0020A20E21|nr:glycosyltransferase family 4 protein [Notoacmeibacter sp. MSK16QG-6]MCP1199065.1 glycosyltransferase family 4 protein [Notoacmeibacter sp. MSK16QG-6]